MNTENANKYLDSFQIYDRSIFDNQNTEHPLGYLLEDYHQEQLKLLNIPPVSKRLKMGDLTEEEKEHFRASVEFYESIGVAAPNGIIMDDIEKRRSE